VTTLRGQGLVFTAPGDMPATVEVLDVSGRVVFAGQFVGLLRGARVGALHRDGIYVCTVRQGERVMTRRVSVVR
jgi:hypothetical protein